jgi:hypothetical protein
LLWRIGYTSASVASRPAAKGDLLVMVASPLRAPRQNGAVVAVPPLAEAGALLAHNRRQQQGQIGDIFGRSWTELRQEARASALAQAQRYFEEAGEPLPSNASPASFVMAGHQPELFHPGVWIKNFSLNRIGRLHGVTPLNFIVDNDTAKANVLRVPSPIGPRVHLVPFDHGRGEVPFEERPVLDEALFASFADRAGDVMAGWGFEPILRGFWAEVRRHAARTPLLGERLVAARRTFERRWGCHNLEVPLSRLCATESFGRFVFSWFHDWPRFHTAYNEAVRAYRQRNGIRSRQHPVPDLGRDGDWWELPLWAWRTDRPQRNRLMIRIFKSQLETRIGEEIGPRLFAPFQWRNLERQGWKIRSRALTTTLYARLFLADLFIHGIGGGKYDEVTDDIIRRYYGFEPPGLMILSATLWLPVPDDPVQPTDLRTAVHELRDIHWNPQRHLQATANGAVQALTRQKNDWINRAPTSHSEKRSRFRTLRELTQHLRPFVAEQEEAALGHVEECRQQLQANEVRHDRTYAFCLFPEKELRAFCERFL